MASDDRDRRDSQNTNTAERDPSWMQPTIASTARAIQGALSRARHSGSGPSRSSRSSSVAGSLSGEFVVPGTPRIDAFPAITHPSPFSWSPPSERQPQQRIKAGHKRAHSSPFNDFLRDEVDTIKRLRILSVSSKTQEASSHGPTSPPSRHGSDSGQANNDLSPYTPPPSSHSNKLVLYPPTACASNTGESSKATRIDLPPTVHNALNITIPDTPPDHALDQIQASISNFLQQTQVRNPTVNISFHGQNRDDVEKIVREKFTEVHSSIAHLSDAIQQNSAQKETSIRQIQNDVAAVQERQPGVDIAAVSSFVVQYMAPFILDIRTLKDRANSPAIQPNTPARRCHKTSDQDSKDLHGAILSTVTRLLTPLQDQLRTQSSELTRLRELNQGLSNEIATLRATSVSQSELQDVHSLVNATSSHSRAIEDTKSHSHSALMAQLSQIRSRNEDLARDIAALRAETELDMVRMYDRREDLKESVFIVQREAQQDVLALRTESQVDRSALRQLEEDVRGIRDEMKGMGGDEDIKELRKAHQSDLDAWQRLETEVAALKVEVERVASTRRPPELHASALEALRSQTATLGAQIEEIRRTRPAKEIEDLHTRLHATEQEIRRLSSPKHEEPGTYRDFADLRTRLQTAEHHLQSHVSSTKTAMDALSTKWDDAYQSWCSSLNSEYQNARSTFAALVQQAEAEIQSLAMLREQHTAAATEQMVSQKTELEQVVQVLQDQLERRRAEFGLVIGAAQELFERQKGEFERFIGEGKIRLEELSATTRDRGNSSREAKSKQASASSQEAGKAAIAREEDQQGRGSTALGEESKAGKDGKRGLETTTPATPLNDKTPRAQDEHNTEAVPAAEQPSGRAPKQAKTPNRVPTISDSTPQSPPPPPTTSSPRATTATPPKKRSPDDPLITAAPAPASPSHTQSPARRIRLPITPKKKRPAAPETSPFPPKPASSPSTARGLVGPAFSTRPSEGASPVQFLDSDPLALREGTDWQEKTKGTVGDGPQPVAETPASLSGQKTRGEPAMPTGVGRDISRDPDDVFSPHDTQPELAHIPGNSVHESPVRKPQINAQAKGGAGGESRLSPTLASSPHPPRLQGDGHKRKHSDVDFDIDSTSTAPRGKMPKR